VNQGEHLHLVIIEDTGEKADSHASILRNAGFSLRSDTVHDFESLKNCLDAALPDLVICGEGTGVPDLKTVFALINGSAENILSRADLARELAYDFNSEVG
jgi:hypothetical protein